MSTDIAPFDSELATEPRGGLGALATSRGNLPLDAVDVRAVIAGLSASVEVTQGFRNPFDVALEATYIFPLPDRAAVTAMRMEAAGHVVEGVLKERSQEITAGQPKARDRVLVLVTDGQVGNEDQILQQVARRWPGSGCMSSALTGH